MNFNAIQNFFTTIGGNHATAGVIILGIYGSTEIEACKSKCLSNFSCLQECPNLMEYAAFGAFLGFLFFLAHSFWKKSRENKIG